MTIILLLASIILTTSLLALPGVAPYVHAFVSVAKYPAYAYYVWQYTTSLLRRLLSVDPLALPIARLSQTYHSARRLLTPDPLLCAGSELLLWVARATLIRSGLLTMLAGLEILNNSARVLLEPPQPVRHTLLKNVRPYCQGLGVHTRPHRPPVGQALPAIYLDLLAMRFVAWYDLRISSYPITLFVGLLTLIVLWHCVLKLLLLGALGVQMLAYAYVVVISLLARSLLSLGLVHWIFLGLALEHKFALKDFSSRELTGFVNYTILAFILHEDVLVQRLCDARSFLRSGFYQGALRVARFHVNYVCVAPLKISLRLITTGTYMLLRRLIRRLFEHVIVPAVRLIVFKAVCWTCIVCAVGCAVAVAITIKLFAALLVPVYSIRRRHKPSEEAPGTSQPPVLVVEYSDRSSISLEEVLPTPPSPSSDSAASESVRRLGLFINAYLDESISARLNIELEGEFKNTRSMHAPPPVQTTPPPTPFYSLPATPLLSPASPVDSALPADPRPLLAFELADEDEDMTALATRLSHLHIEFEAAEVPRRSRCGSQRSVFTLEA
ncbi:hypothetical protein RhiJN_00264 [Ceratobasidium sp. AG-Ba]|nr:hypothetical protein RhiJN_00264 [Ceratobasidium sp. AG-Ba]